MSMHNLRAVQVIMRLKSPHFHIYECQGANARELDGSAVSERSRARPCYVALDVGKDSCWPG